MESQSRLIAITGATGFVGRHVVRRLMKEPDLCIRCLVRASSDARELEALGTRISLVRGDLSDVQSLAPLLEGAWGVINLAGYRDFWSRSRDLYYDLNAQGAENVFRAALDAKLKKVVQVSTPLAFGVPDEIPFNEDSEPGPHPSDYARSKYLADKIGWRMHSELGLPLTIVHLAAVIGAGDSRPTMEVRRAVERRLPVLIGADTTYTYVHVQDAAEAIVRALLSSKSIGRRYLIGTERASTRDYFALIGDLANVPVPKYNMPEAPLIPVAKLLERFARWTGKRPSIPVDILQTIAAGSLVFDGSRAKGELGMQYTPLRAALSEAVAEIQAESR
ncbi:MAG: NAD-dependent epimerase/dehydratase family protein [Deltaproteobacteria bacterium]|nr:MAG: NAD-dependent epimerase/dehydratase family protein [Deltaproteobacteria bacterium]UCF47440.1 MAG: NAD-dependent epimerase/dehydratase family protein [Myxococcales bacterium]